MDYDTISFDGLHISVADLKKEIIQKKKLGKTQDFDLQITNAQTKEGECGADFPFEFISGWVQALWQSYFMCFLIFSL